MESEPRAMSMSEDDIQGIPNKWLEVVIHYAMGSRNDTIDFSKPHLRPSVARMYPLFVFLYVVIVIAGTFSNCAMIYSIIRDKLYRDQTYCYLINMALGDIVKCVFVLPISLMVLLVQNWVFGSFLCYFLPMLQDIPIHVSMLTFLMIAYDRHRFLQDPTKPRIPAFVCATGTWLMALCIVLPYPIYTTYLDLGTFNRGQLSGVGICAVNLADDMQEYMRGLFIAMYVLPLAVMAYLYVRMSRELQLQEGPLAVIMYEARSRASTNFRTCRSVSDMSSSDAPDEDIKTDVETLNYQQCLATQSISGKRESGHSEPHFRYRSPTANFDLYEAELDLRKEKRAQKYLISMVTMFGICLCPLMVLRLAKLALPETYENSGHFDITFTMFVWIAFLPTCITPLLYASWRMSRSAKERLRGYFRLSNRHLRRSSESPVERRSGQNHETSSQNNVHGGRNSDGGVWLQYCEFKYYYLLTLPAMPLGI